MRSPKALRAEIAPRLSELNANEIIIPHDISERHLKTARTFMSRHVGPKSQVEAQVHALLEMLSSASGFGLQYEWAATRNADATIEHGGGSCLSLSAVLVGLARGLGIRAYYVDASKWAPDHQKDGNLTVHSGHIAVVLQTEQAEALVDFAGEIDHIYGTRRIDDLEVVAHFYNNLGYELIHRAQKDHMDIPWNEALTEFRIATKIVPKFALAWNNAGLALQRLGRNKEALLAFHYALLLDPEMEAARRNLAAWHGQKPFIEIDERTSAPHLALKWQAMALGPTAVTWQIALLPKLGLQAEVPETTIESDR